MSYSICIDYEPCATCGRCASYAWDPTYNFAPMFRAAGLDLHALDGRPAAEAARIVRAAYERMVADPATYRAHNPPNGWGSYDGVLPHLRRFAEALEQGRGTVRVR